MKTHVVAFYNSWGNRVELYTGSESKCTEWLENFLQQSQKWPSWIEDEPHIEKK